MTNPLDQFKQTYFEECRERLAEAEQNLLALDKGEGGSEAKNAIFRAVHSIKGGAGAFGFETLVAFAHVFENLLEALRSDKVTATREVIDTLIKANDALVHLVQAAENGHDVPADFARELKIKLSTLAAPNAMAPQLATQTLPAAAPVPPSADNGQQVWHITFKPHASLYAKANEPLLLLRELKNLGEVTVTTDISALPDITNFNPHESYLSFSIQLVTSAPQERIQEVFEFVSDDCNLTITPAAESKNTTTKEPTVTTAAPSAAPAAHSIRVELDKVDRLVNMVGELVITQAMLAQQAGHLPADQFSHLLQGLQELGRHTRELQESVMAIRAQPVRSIFSRMPRLVRDIASSLGKDVRLIMQGEETEVDKTVIEQIGDPLTHMIRNAVDHGIELPALREQAGKPRQGTIILSAQHRSGRIAIDIQDDGAGINRSKVLQKAQRLGLVAPDAKLSDEEIDQLLFAPGLSTAEKVSDISGRGVGMDVVKRNIQALGGRVQVRSTPGQGSCFTLSLPLTLAVLDGMVVRVGRDFMWCRLPILLNRYVPAKTV